MTTTAARAVPSLEEACAFVRTCVRDIGGHPGARLQRALAAGNLIAAKQAAFDVTSIPLAEARSLVELYAEKGDRKFDRASVADSRRRALGRAVPRDGDFR